ncbi:MAG TPA: DUF4412 domain-containing protein [Verrucomicrobiae bacterium]|nr:DUF4412 domain-containing protein [Verrucomicrobiae bacterium]
MKPKVIALALLAALVCTSSHAQRPGGGPFGGGMAPGVDQGFTKYFGDNNAFSAKAECTMDGPEGTPVVMVMNMTMLDGKTRMEMDMTQMRGTKMPPTAIASMKQMGMDRTIMITLPEKKTSYMIYPSLQAYVENPMRTDTENPEAGKKPKIEKTSLGKESIDGHPCDKNKVVITMENGKTHEAIVWNAPDLKDFPLQMQMSEAGRNMTMKFKDVSLDKPDAKLFEPPADATKYDSQMQLMQNEVMKRAGGLRKQ